MRQANDSRQRVLSRRAARELDRRAIEDFGIPSAVLMENAGRACADELCALPEFSGGEILVLCGPGNNGGDGFVIARTLLNRGHAACLAFIGTQALFAKSVGGARLNADLWERSGGACPCVHSAEAVAALAADVQRADVVVDALFGTGLTRLLEDPYVSVIRLLNRSARAVLAVDLPSGLDADSGAVLGACVRATRTVSFVGFKPGFFAGAGPEHVGDLVSAEIGIPRGYLDSSSPSK